MLRACIFVAGLALAAAPLAGGARSAATRLTISLYPNGTGAAAVRHYRLTCAPAGGTVPHPALACRTLAGLAHPFAPVPASAVCTALSLGPQEAFVTGTLRGRPVDTHLDLQGGCQIDRWRRLARVVPGFPGATS